MESALRSKNLVYQRKVSFKCLANKSNLINKSTELKNHKMIPGGKVNRKSRVLRPVLFWQEVKAETVDTLKDEGHQ